MNAATSRSRSGYGSTSRQPEFEINLKPAAQSSSTFFHSSRSDIFGALNARPIQCNAPPHWGQVALLSFEIFHDFRQSKQACATK